MNQKKDTYEDLLKKSNTILYEQSSKVSTICRSVIYAMFATIWAISYEDGCFNIPQGIMLYTLGTCIVFLFIDVLHYFIETCFHFRTTQVVFRFRVQSDGINEADKKRFVRNSKRSFRFIIYKFAITIIAMVMFGYSVIIEL